jgi:hypothetical protein
MRSTLVGDETDELLCLLCRRCATVGNWQTKERKASGLIHRGIARKIEE